jgi:4-hydroxy-tetrahydrodipicolinate synthase
MFSGALTALTTPFTADGKLDEDRLRAQIEFQIKEGIDGLVPVGTTGESPTLDMREHIRVIELTVEQARGRVPVIAGVGANATAEAIELHNAAKKIGATAGLSVNPYYNKPTQEGLYRHFMTLADAVDLPIVLYNIPSRTGITMSAQTIARLHQHRNIVAVKEATGLPDMTSEIRSLSDITILSGDDSLTLPLMSIGARGVVSVVSNLLPGDVKKLAEHALNGDFNEASRIHFRLFPLVKSLFIDGNPAGIKHAMQLRGMDSGVMRLPLVPVSEGTAKLIRELTEKLAATDRR